jgi:hypothetical protein
MQDRTQDKQLSPKTIPDKLPGTVQPQYVRCGKPNCKCAHGELHGPYWYRLWREWDGKQHKEYVRKSDVERVRAACEAQQQELREAVAVLARGRKVVKSYARGKAGTPRRFDNAAELFENPLALKEFFEPFVVFHELSKLAESQKGGIMVMIEAVRLLTDLYGYVRLSNKPGEHRSRPGGLWAEIMGRSGKEMGSSDSSTAAKSTDPH